MNPVYPYLNSMTGLNDPGDAAQVGDEIMQKDLPEYKNMSRSAVCKDLIQKAEDALPSLVEICKALAGSLGMEEVGVGAFMPLVYDVIQLDHSMVDWMFQLSFKLMTYFFRTFNSTLSSLSSHNHRSNQGSFCCHPQSREKIRWRCTQNRRLLPCPTSCQRPNCADNY